MASHPRETVSPDEPDGAPSGRQSDGPAPSTIYQTEIAVLRCRVAALETELECERERRQTVVDRYEHLLDQR